MFLTTVKARGIGVKYVSLLLPRHDEDDVGMDIILKMHYGKELFVLLVFPFKSFKRHTSCLG